MSIIINLNLNLLSPHCHFGFAIGGPVFACSKLIIIDHAVLVRDGHKLEAQSEAHRFWIMGFQIPIRLELLQRSRAHIHLPVLEIWHIRIPSDEVPR